MKQPQKLETTYPAVVGQIIAKVREAQGIDQATLSQKSGISRPTLSRIESGEADLKTTDLAKIVKAIPASSAADIFTQADETCRLLDKAGVTVRPERATVSKKSNSGAGGFILAALGAVALGAIIDHLSESKGEESPEEGEDK